MASVTLVDVNKQYGGHVALQGVNVAVEDGAFVVLVGPSGCGKSTLLRMIAGLEEITGGDILIGGQVVNRTPPKDRDISMVFQNYALYPHMTVAENMAFSLTLAKAPKAEKSQRVNRAAEILNLTPLLDRYPRHLSGGQRQRVAMGRSIVRNPKVFLFDEPLSNLDAKLRVAMRAEIKELHQRLRTTTIYVTHDQIEAMTMADQIVVMNQGRVEQIGAPLDLYDRPANIFVAGFIGSPSMNLLEGTVDSGGSGQTFRSKEGISLPLPDAKKFPRDVPLVYGFRPEHISLASDSSGVVAKIVVLEPTGAETLVKMDLQGTTVVAVFKDRLQARSGDSIRILPDPSRVCIFDHRSGQRLDGEAVPMSA
jgi:multiple sugar transport system ATP-binding protein